MKCIICGHDDTESYFDDPRTKGMIAEIHAKHERCFDLTVAATQALFEMRNSAKHLDVHLDSYFEAINALKKLLEAKP